MSKVTFVSPADAPFVSAGAYMDNKGTARSDLQGESRDTQEVRVYFEGSADSPSLAEVRAGPDKPTVPHAHEVDEIVYVLEGSLHVGDRAYGPGCAIHVPANTMYAFRVGPEGVRYLNMKPRADVSYISRERFVAEGYRDKRRKAP